jgi:hypothetical protein
MVDGKAWAGYMIRSLTQLACTPAILHELGASAADMAQHLVQPTAPSYLGYKY